MNRDFEQQNTAVWVAKNVLWARGRCNDGLNCLDLWAVG
ncbi:hypothetical protein MIZ03_1704 [Rhodoferax lithotrophicus]|uniref:Uncharacterized protein n=1 Tax=Rhodoferax lithotrophicus TaxID=2798804 RepID=A0ABM7MKV7_9BURK|nr:hypothetical protein MIZ03_1704 [Rhodoferax sp. MIZ03]